MVVEAVQNYVNLVNGLSRTTRARAVSTAKSLLAHAGLEDVANDAGERVGKLAEEIVQASKANRELLEKLIASEVDRAAARLGFVRAEDLDALRTEIADLRQSLVQATVSASTAPTRSRRTTTSSVDAETAVKTAAVKKAAVKKAAVKKAPVKKAPSNTAAKKVSAQRTAAKKAPAEPVVEPVSPIPLPAGPDET
jgi:hypothetical protein